MELPATEPVSSTYHGGPDVFINHGGPDVKKTLASLIYHYLKSPLQFSEPLLSPLELSEMLHTGDALSPAILGAIESASVHIAIFSKRYAESRRCLDELCWILRCNRKIIPVFCDVEPADLRHIDRDNGSFREAIEKHQREGRVAMEDIEKWKTALNKASDISGLMWKTNESDHGEVLEEIVKAVINRPRFYKPQGSSTYHVFINHRGPDVKKTLASLIYHRLRACGLRVFLDKEELHTGDALSPAIFGAIESASVHIAIFSERYAESRWCLEELCSILAKSDRKIIPVFYDVEPTDLRYIDSGRYKKAFEEHQRKGRVAKEDMEKWKTALNQASEIPGLPFKTNESDLGEVVERIVKQVLKEVKWEPRETLVSMANYLVGLDLARTIFAAGSVLLDHPCSGFCYCHIEEGNLLRFILADHVEFIKIGVSCILRRVIC